MVSPFCVLPRPSQLRGQLELRLCNRRRCSRRYNPGRVGRRQPLLLASSVANQLYGPSTIPNLAPGDG